MGVGLAIVELFITRFRLQGIWHSHYSKDKQTERAKQAIDDSTYSTAILGIFTSTILSWLSMASVSILCERFDVFAITTVVFLSVVLGFGMVAGHIVTPTRFRDGKRWKFILGGVSVAVPLVTLGVVLYTLSQSQG